MMSPMPFRWDVLVEVRVAVGDVLSMVVVLAGAFDVELGLDDGKSSCPVLFPVKQ